MRSVCGACQWVVIRHSSGQRPRRASPFCGSHCSRFHVACPSVTALLVWRSGPTQHLVPRPGQNEGQPGSSSGLSQDSKLCLSSRRSVNQVPWKQKRSWTADAFLSPGCRPQLHGHLSAGSGRMPLPNNDEPDTAYSLARTIRRRLPVIPNSANRAALRDWASCPSEIPPRRTDQKAEWRESRSKQAASPILPTRFHHLINGPCHNTNSHSVLSSPLSLKTLCPDPHAQNGSSPW